MHSIRTKITAATICSIIVTMIIALTLGVIAIRNIGKSDSEQMLLLLCKAGQKNLDDCLEDAEKDVNTVTAYVESDLNGLDDETLQAHLDRVSDFCKKIINQSNGIVTYYYRIDPNISEKAKGFWFVKTDENVFSEHEVTDITLYDTEDTSQLVWFTVPKATGGPTWLPPYVTDNLDIRVLSYNVPVYYKGRFVGVFGIELDYSYMAGLVDNITLYESGLSFISDEEGYIVYHPKIDVLTLSERPEIPDGFNSKDPIIHYSYDGVAKIAAWLPLVNGDHLNVSVPVAEISATWRRWVNMIVLSFSALLAAFIIIFMNYTKRITKPLEDLKKAAEQIDEGKYEYSLDYKGDDEIGDLTRTLIRVSANLKNYITDLNDLAYADALTSLHNKGAFDIYIGNLQAEKDKRGSVPPFAVVVFDCNNLKTVNDQNGHDKGDIYLKNTAQVICEVFDHSPVFRIGGDEFTAILIGKDYENRKKLLQMFDEKCAEMRKHESDVWKQVDVARGIAEYNPQEDETISDVVRRADRNMYENKWNTKEERR